MLGCDILDLGQHRIGSHDHQLPGAVGRDAALAVDLADGRDVLHVVIRLVQAQGLNQTDGVSSGWGARQQGTALHQSPGKSLLGARRRGPSDSADTRPRALSPSRRLYRDRPPAEARSAATVWQVAHPFRLWVATCRSRDDPQRYERGD